MTVEERVKTITASKLDAGAKEISSTDRLFEDLGLDSLDVVELLVAFEEEFGIKIPPQDAEKLHTVQDVINYVNAHKS